jgi:hypothetical protein
MKQVVRIGGSLPESAVQELIQVLQDDQVKLIEGEQASLEEIQERLRAYVGSANKAQLPVELEFELEYDMDGEVHPELQLDDFCKEHNLTFKKVLPPCVGGFGEHYNECICYWEPGMDNEISIPTDGDQHHVVRLDDVQVAFEALWRAHRLVPEDEYPLHVNSDNSYTKFYALERMAGKDFGQIFAEYLLTKIGHEERACPPFTIIKGK